MSLLLLLLACAPTPVDADLDGSPSTEDCNDADEMMWPGAWELCDGKDNDCDGVVDEDPVDLRTLYVDGDGDGYGGTNTVAGCPGDAGTAENNDDCDDADGALYPGNAELCDGVDNDCDGLVDDEDELDSAAGAGFWPDQDDDGYGDASWPVVWACSTPSGYVQDDTDCNDYDDDVFPGAVEDCNGLDDDCDGSLPDEEADLDGDGWSTCDGDPDDTDALVRPLTEAKVGGDDRSYTASGSFRGNLYVAQQDAILVRFTMALEFEGDCDIEAYVFGADSGDGPWTLEWSAVVDGDPEGDGWLDSGEVDLETTDGRAYVLGYGWSCEARYFSGNYGSWEGDDGGVGVVEGSAWNNSWEGGDFDFDGTAGANAATYWQVISVYR